MGFARARTGHSLPDREAALRTIGPIDTAAGLGGGDHACFEFADDETHRAVVSRYLNAGLDAGERILFLGSPAGRELLAIEYLHDQGRDPERLLEEGTLLIGVADEAYRPGGTFDPDARVASYRDLAERALADGFAGLRIAADTSWLLDDPEAFELWPGYELRADILMTQFPLLALCCYDARKWDAPRLAEIRSVHAARMPGEMPHAGFTVHGGDGGQLMLGGEVDLLTADLLERALTAGARQTDDHRLDVSQLRFADVAAMRAIRAAASQMAQRSGCADIEGASATFKKVWELLVTDVPLEGVMVS